MHWLIFYSNNFASKGLFRVKMHSFLLRPGSDNSISLWCKLRHTIDLSNFLFGITVSFDLSFYFFFFFETCTQPFCKRHYPVIVITITRHVLCTGNCTRLYILKIIKAWPLCFYEHVDTRISSLSYIKLKRLDNDIKTKSIAKTCTNYETKGKPRKKKATSRYRTRI